MPPQSLAHVSREMIVRVSLHTFICRISVVVVALALPLLAPTAAGASSTSQVRRAFGEMFLSNAPGCSLATAQGRIFLVEMQRGQEHYLPSTTCEEAFSEAQQEFLSNPGVQVQVCRTAATLKRFLKSAIVRVKGKRATIQLVEDLYCYTNENVVTGAAAARLDPIGITHWIKRRGRWLFDNAPTGTYSPTGRKSAALLRSALSGGIITQSGPSPFDSAAASFCANGSSHLTWLSQFIPNGGPWYVVAGYSTTYKPEPPFDAQGNAQGAVFVYQPVSVEWDIKLVGGTIVASSATPEPAVFQPGAAGC